VLSELTIQNFAIIDQLHLRFAPGFTVLTGETGAGKSIIIDAVSSLLGGRADATLIRAGTDTARIEGVFCLAPSVWDELAPQLEEQGIEQADVLVLTREIKANGHNVCRINGQAVTLAAFGQLGQNLIDIHGQGEHLSLLKVREHLGFLDRFAGLSEERTAVAGGVSALRRVRRDLQSLRQDERELARKVDLLQYQLHEIEDAALDGGEEERLLAERNVLLNAERLTQLADGVYQQLGGGDETQRAVADMLAAVTHDMHELERLDPRVSGQRQTLEEISYQIDDVTRYIRAYRDGVEYNPVRLAAVEERLALLHSLKRKYGSTVDDILRFLAKAAAELEGITHQEERLAELEAEETRLVQQVGELARSLSERRQTAIASLAAAVEEELGHLSMQRAQFMVDVQQTESDEGLLVGTRRLEFDETGVDRVEFLISPNLGEPPKPMVKIASGGETSRLMLALKTVLATADPVPTLIFDEIDQGIGGRTGGVVGRKLWDLTAAHQVLCVTHLPQLACYADQHLQVDKVVQEGRTTTQVKVLDEDGRIAELSAMIGGPPGSARDDSAREMYHETIEIKKRARAD